MAGEAGGKEAAAADRSIPTPGAAASCTPARNKDGSVSGGSNKSPVGSKTPDPAATLSARLGGMVLMDKEEEGFVFEDPDPHVRKDYRWSAVGKVCSPRPMKMSVVEKTLPRAWGLHKEAKFAEIGPNIFEVHFGSEGDYRHVIHNGPWQFDFSVLVMKKYEGNTRPSEMIFDKIDVWVRIADLPPDKRTEVFGKDLGDWLGETVRVDVDKDGIARGQYFRVRTKISVFEPLVRGIFLRKDKADKEKTWFDFYYEKVPHFCFDCGRLVHEGGECEPPVDSSSQWGGWLRASPGRNNPGKEGSKGGGSCSFNSQGSSHTGETANHNPVHPRAREVPTKRNLQTEFSRTSDGRTGDQSKQGGTEVISPNRAKGKMEQERGHDLRDSLEARREHEMRSKLMDQNLGSQRGRRVEAGREWKEYENSSTHSRNYVGRGSNGCHAEVDRVDPLGGPDMHGTRGRRRGFYVRKERPDSRQKQQSDSHLWRDGGSGKRGPRQVWRAKGDAGARGAEDEFIRDTRQKTASVFDRIQDRDDEAADPGAQGRRTQ